MPIFLALAACGKESLPQKPQLILDRDSLGFGLEFGRGTYIGTSPQESLLVENGGLEDLVFSSVTLTGDPAFKHEGPSKDRLKGRERGYIRVIFTPTQLKDYAATLTLSSNAENTPTKTIAITGRGVKQSADGG